MGKASCWHAYIGAENRNNIATDVGARGNGAQLLHYASTDKGIPLATALPIAEVAENTLWRRSWQPHSCGGTQHLEGRRWFSIHGTKIFP
jgi:hypothetical protein